ncbi:MAG: hypothetical protein AAFY19_04145 [Pseudomonadota bacterium]
MSMRTSSLLLGIAALTACAPESGAPEGVRIECALAPDAAFSSQCVLEDSGAGALTIHHPDDTFQRVRYDAATNVLMSADGAQLLVLDPDPSAGTVEFSIGPAKYRIERRVLTAPLP